LGAELSAAYPEGLTVVAVLTSSIIFAADLVRNVSVPCRIEFFGISRFRPGDRRARIVKDLDHDVSGQHVVIVDCAVDTGLTCSFVIDALQGAGAASVAVCALIDSPPRRIVPVEVSFVGTTAHEARYFGFGMDLAGSSRNLPYVACSPVTG
jgi:hypoxanthine phosphoribosyltransferase